MLHRSTPAVTRDGVLDAYVIRWDVWDAARTAFAPGSVPGCVVPVTTLEGAQLGEATLTPDGRGVRAIAAWDPGIVPADARRVMVALDPMSIENVAPMRDRFTHVRVVALRVVSPGVARPPGAWSRRPLSPEEIADIKAEAADGDCRRRRHLIRERTARTISDN